MEYYAKDAALRIEGDPEGYTPFPDGNPETDDDSLAVCFNKCSFAGKCCLWHPCDSEQRLTGVFYVKDSYVIQSSGEGNHASDLPA